MPSFPYSNHLRLSPDCTLKRKSSSRPASIACLRSSQLAQVLLSTGGRFDSASHFTQFLLRVVPSFRNLAGSFLSTVFLYLVGSLVRCSLYLANSHS